MFHSKTLPTDCNINCGIVSELECMWKEAVVAYFEVVSLHLHGCTEENHDRLQSE
jgi:hypothetical protein